MMMFFVHAIHERTAFWFTVREREDNYGGNSSGIINYLLSVIRYPLRKYLYIIFFIGFDLQEKRR